MTKRWQRWLNGRIRNPFDRYPAWGVLLALTLGTPVLLEGSRYLWVVALVCGVLYALNYPRLSLLLQRTCQGARAALAVRPPAILNRDKAGT